MRFLAKLWQQYVDTNDWHDVAHVQCRPKNLLIILVVILSIKSLLVHLGAFDSWVEAIYPTCLGLVAIWIDYLVWHLRKTESSKRHLIALYLGIEGFLYGACCISTAAIIGVPYGYALWCIYIATLIYWGTITGFSLIEAVFHLSGPLVVLFICDGTVIDFIILGFGAVIYSIIAKNTGFRRVVDAKNMRTKAAIATAEQVLEKYHEQIQVVQSLIVHDLKNKIHSIVCNAGALKIRAENGEQITDGQDVLSDICESALASSNLLKRSLTAMARANGVFDVFKMNEYVLATDLLRIDTPLGHTKVIGNIEHLMFVINNLVENAVEAGANDILLTSDQDEEFVYLFISDDGPGFKKVSKGKLFSPQQSSKQNGAGLGLFLSQQLLKGVGGSLSLADRPGNIGATFEIKICKAK